MRIPCSLLLICFAASPGNTANSRERLRDPLTFCGHFLINNPDAAINGSSGSCCGFDNQIHDCRVHDWDE